MNRKQKAKFRQLSQTLEIQKAEYSETIRILHHELANMQQENDALRAEAAEWRQERVDLLHKIEE